MFLGLLFLLITPLIRQSHCCEELYAFPNFTRGSTSSTSCSLTSDLVPWCQRSVRHRPQQFGPGPVRVPGGVCGGKGFPIRECDFGLICKFDVPLKEALDTEAKGICVQRFVSEGDFCGGNNTPFVLECEAGLTCEKDLKFTTESGAGICRKTKAAKMFLDCSNGDPVPETIAQDTRPNSNPNTSRHIILTLPARPCPISSVTNPHCTVHGQSPHRLRVTTKHRLSYARWLMQAGLPCTRGLWKRVPFQPQSNTPNHQTQSPSLTKSYDEGSHRCGIAEEKAVLTPLDKGA
ncbi:hypothetical protein BDK51DRAFT_29253 [Blyttiomyces helicus]|uniref:Uncharacterized protein n=1 Tax=Blyttiomyces helicus TaxID=388810 RepID=A0A4P9WBG3_9FUNG|nr:hypothetical protein BDK51DRAFT_29253 [Blyttiomyces helicus]|eukprot:RKO89959.1 hypothetical protein BDK51DRAFT_29253 [Blyttiomyces helicus]